MRYAFCTIAKRPPFKLYPINPLSKAHNKYKKMEFCIQKRSVNIQPPPPRFPALRARKVPREGGVQMKAISDGVGGCLKRFFFFQGV